MPKNGSFAGMKNLKMPNVSSQSIPSIIPQIFESKLRANKINGLESIRNISSTLIPRNETTQESLKLPINLSKVLQNDEKFTLVDISNRNNDLNKMFSKISPKRYHKSNSKKF